VAATAAAAVLVHLACGNAYGVLRDELYFLACGRHPAFGYVDQPPVVPLLARLAAAVFGPTPMGLRIPAYLAHAGTVWATALLAGRLGGGPRARLLAAAMALVAPGLLGGAHLLTMSSVEPLLWTGVLLGVLRAVDGDRRGGWLLAGACVGFGLLTKYSMVFWVTALLAGLLATEARRALASGWLLAAVAVAAVLALPNFFWQAAHGFPMLELLGRMSQKNVQLGPGSFLLEVLKGANPFVAWVWGAGLVWLLVDRLPGRRWLGLAVVAVVAAFLALHAKPYFLYPALPAVYAAGGCIWERSLSSPGRLAARLVYLGVSGAAMALLTLPLLSPPAFAALQARIGAGAAPDEKLSLAAPLPNFLADQLGWPELVLSIADAHRALPPALRARAAVIAPDYGVAAAIDLYGPPLGLPRATAGHNNYWLWGPPPDDARAVLLVGPGPRDAAGDLCGRLVQVGETPDSRWNMPYERRVPIYLCTEITRPFRTSWARFRYVY